MTSHKVAFATRRTLLPKRGSTQRECEDAVSCNEQARRFAIADGATEAFDSRRWARYLCHAWTSLPHGEPSDAVYLRGLGQLAARFNRTSRSGPKPWFVEAKAEQGSFATFLGVELSPVDASGGTWQATAVGDCCLFIFVADALQTAFPIEDAESFGSHPAAVPTLSSGHMDLRAAVRRTAGIYQSGDSFLLATDAASQWLLRMYSAEPPFVARLLACLRSCPDEFLSEIEEARDSGLMRNDDVGLLLIEPRTSHVGSPPALD